MMKETEAHKNSFDYIVIGAGLSGLSLVTALKDYLISTGKRLLLIDRSFEEYANRTWSFWEEHHGNFDFLCHTRWQKLRLYTDEKQIISPTNPFTYKSVSSEDFRSYCFNIIQSHPQITMHTDDVTDITQSTGEELIVMTKSGRFITNSVFDSRFDPDMLKHSNANTLWQQFQGYFVKTDFAAFDKEVADIMDFRAEQKNHVAFFYTLPSDTNKALIEYTLFTPILQPPEYFERNLRQYLDQHIGRNHYEITKTEEGKIPMTSYRFPRRKGNIIYLGTAAGCSKASTGYTFYFIQKQIGQILNHLKNETLDQYASSPTFDRFHFYDRILLRILKDQPEKGHRILFSMFQRNDAARVFRFLNNDTSLLEELRLFVKLPIFLFSLYALKELFGVKA
ncbi:lycopene cyclase family protein [Sphingobacterium spiritivorum ATCC 33300]|uniref:Lycopene cyclase family protein n=1 Tax=Sphingobacterium spiritivorum ATCC 33300 TaxID=525372 RepID=C2G5C8_SPHSI|nr:lycopene cyclase family protein [Sphingobacterium spiritivorum]EEI89637.1 lycopene cyclase family protein [Sphingobacterium spiritivorum ATCC 33300]QQS94618.1 lycopene cyclase [Sphingobacterium spiritivorum]